MIYNGNFFVYALVTSLFQGYMKVNEDDDFKSSAYICDLNNKLYPCFEYILWGDPANVDAMRTLYARRTPFPFNFVYPQKYMKLAEDFLETFANFNINDKVEFHKNTEVIYFVILNFITSQLVLIPIKNLLSIFF